MMMALCRFIVCLNWPRVADKSERQEKRAMSRVLGAVRSHRVFLVITGVLTVVMTWPTVYYLLRPDLFWVPTRDRDVWMKFWDVWYGKLILAGKVEPAFTDSLFSLTDCHSCTTISAFHICWHLAYCRK